MASQQEQQTDHEAGMKMMSISTPIPVSAFKYFFHDPEFLRKYKDTTVYYPVYETLLCVEKFQSDPRDICITTFPKAGTTFMSAVVYMIAHDGNPKSLTEGLPLEVKVPYLEGKNPLMKDVDLPVHQIQAKQPPRLFFTHLAYESMPRSIMSQARIVYVARNPKDCILSNYHFLRAYISGFKGTLEDMAQAFFDNKCVHAPFYDHVADMWTGHHNQGNIFFTTFERMKKDLKTVARDLGTFLGKTLTEQQLTTINLVCNFDSMKGNTNVNRAFLEKCGLCDFSISPYMRAGKVGNWKEHFTPELNEKVNQWIAREEYRLRDSLIGFEFEYE